MPRIIVRRNVRWAELPADIPADDELISRALACFEETGLRGLLALGGPMFGVMAAGAALLTFCLIS